MGYKVSKNPCVALPILMVPTDTPGSLAICCVETKEKPKVKYTVESMGPHGPTSAGEG